VKPYEFIEHTADVIVKAYGETLQQAFGNAALGMFDVITGGATIRGDRRIEFDVSSIDREGLLVKFLSELIVIHEVQRFVLSEIDVQFEHEFRLRAVARGERFDPERHGGGTQVKGVSYHLMEIHQGNNGEPCHVQVLFDI